MRLYYQVYADEFSAAINFTAIFNRLRELGDFKDVRITSKQMRIFLHDSPNPDELTEIKIGLTGGSFCPSFIQISATTPVRANELFRRLIQGDGSEGINVYGAEEVEGDAESASL